jgi:hypothetical protein
VTQSSSSLPTNTPLIVIDVQKAFDLPRWGDWNNPSAEANIARPIAAWRASGRPVFHVHHETASPTVAFRHSGVSFALLGCRKLAPEASCSSGLEAVDLVLGEQSAANSVAGSSFLLAPTGPSPRRFFFGLPWPCGHQPCGPALPQPRLAFRQRASSSAREGPCASCHSRMALIAVSQVFKLSSPRMRRCRAVRKRSRRSSGRASTRSETESVRRAAR